MMSDTLRAKAQAFHDLHTADETFLMPNAWTAGSAVILAEAGFQALGTTSAGIAFDLARPDYEGRMGRDEMMEACRRIAEAVDIPVNGDLEEFYGLTPEDAAETVRCAIDAGLAGAGIEDHPGPNGEKLCDPELMADCIRASREIIEASGIPFVLTARAECYLVGHPDPFSESLRRLKIYAAAGADCVYSPGMREAEQIRTVVDEAGAPVNVLVGIANFPLGVEALGALGVRRLSIGGSLARAALGLIQDAAREMREGRFGFLDGVMSNKDLNEMFR